MNEADSSGIEERLARLERGVKRGKRATTATMGLLVFATATGPSAPPTPIAFVQWGSAIIRRLRAHRGRTGTSSTSSAQSGAKASIA
jgi:hypothetical protein